MRSSHVLVAWILGLSLVAGCGQPAGGEPRSLDRSADTASSSGPSGTLRIAWPTEPEILAPKFASGSGLNEFNWVFNSFLTYYDFNGRAHPMIAQDIPSQERGDWVINPDGTMVTTYRIRPNAQWHDGTPLTASDFAFAFQVYLDPDMPVRDRRPETLMSSVEARDDATLVINWKEPYVAANLLGYQQLDPLPRHLLEEKYRTNRANFIFGEEWTSGYVGTGPFRMERWNAGSGLTARANPNWLLGPPRLETLDIRFIADPSTLLANLLAGEVDVLTSPGVRGADAAVARDQWVSRGQGYLRTWEARLRYMAFQFREVPNWQRAVTDVRVRQGLLQAVDRQGLVDTLNFGLGSVAHMFMAPSEPGFAEVDRAITKYAYDPSRAAALLGAAGWQRPQPNAPLTNPAGQTLDIEVWSTAGGTGDQEAAIIADNLKAVGVNSSIYLIPSARQRDNELRTSFPAFETTARSISPDNFVFTSGQIPTPEARFQGPNRGGFRDDEIDRLHNVVLTSFDQGERQRATVELHKRMSELVGIGPLYYDVEVILAKNNVSGPIGNYGPQQGISWNIYEWEVTS